MQNEGATNVSKVQALADSVVLTFFFLLQVGEYHTPSGNRKTRTITQIRRKDLQFWCRRPSLLLDRLFSLSMLAILQADSVTITLDNQKNGQRDTVLHHEALPNNPLCPCKAAARRFVTMRLANPTDPNTILSLYTLHKHILATQMACILKKPSAP